MAEKLSEAEAELYDRQIRLWGIESQEKLRAANILLINIRGLGSEIAKNLLLTGINSLTILDDGMVTEEELTRNFLLDQSVLDKKIVEGVLPKAQALNPNVILKTDFDKVANKNEEYFTQFTLVVATRLDSQTISNISSHCRKHNVKFICGDIWGYFGYCLSDFQEHEFYEDQIKIVKGVKRTHDNSEQGSSSAIAYEKTTVKVQSKLCYPDLSTVLFPKGSDPKKHKRKNPLYYLALAILEFRTSFKRDPDVNTKEKDVATLIASKKQIMEEFDLDISKLKDAVFDVIYGEIGPIASIVGGVMSQEIIKAVSHKEVPVYNMFLLDPLTFNGREETLIF